MKECQHGWKLKPGEPCPDCLWQQACYTGPMEEKSIEIVQNAVRAARNAVKDPVEKNIVHLASIQENNWKAIKLAREFNAQQR